VYLSDGPDRRYPMGSTELAFRHTALKEAGFTRPESALLVQALKALGEEGVTPEVEQRLRDWLPTRLRGAVLKDTGTATGWVRKALRRVFEEDTDGAVPGSGGPPGHDACRLTDVIAAASHRPR
jgi:hypothetical protein